MKGEIKIINIPAMIPKSKANKLQVWTAFNPLIWLPLANASETIQVQEIPIPDVATVIAKEYTDIIRLNIPIVSEPTILAM